jgi:hypothetical protein
MFIDFERTSVELQAFWTEYNDAYRYRQVNVCRLHCNYDDQTLPDWNHVLYEILHRRTFVGLDTIKPATLWPSPRDVVIPCSEHVYGMQKRYLITILHVKKFRIVDVKNLNRIPELKLRFLDIKNYTAFALCNNQCLSLWDQEMGYKQFRIFDIDNSISWYQ